MRVRARVCARACMCVRASERACVRACVCVIIPLTRYLIKGITSPKAPSMCNTMKNVWLLILIPAKTAQKTLLGSMPEVGPEEVKI